MVPFVNPELFWFRVRLYLRVKGLTLLDLSKALGRRPSFIINRSNQNKVTKREAKKILSVLGLSEQDMFSPIEAFAVKHLRVANDEELGSEREIRSCWETGPSCLDEV